MKSPPVSVWHLNQPLWVRRLPGQAYTTTAIMDKSSETMHIESQDEVKPQIMGNVKLLQGTETVLVPTPSPDPNGKKHAAASDAKPG